MLQNEEKHFLNPLVLHIVNQSLHPKGLFALMHHTFLPQNENN